jgi:uncharacterized protein (DUF885 family)
MRRLLSVFALAAVATAGPKDELHRLLQEDLEAQMRRSPTWATARGDRRYDHLLTDIGPEACRAWIEETKARKAAVAKIDLDELPAAEKTNARLLDYELSRRLESLTVFRPELMPVTQLGGPQRSLPQLASRITFSTDEHFEDYVARLELVPRYLEQVTANMRAGLAAGRTPPRVTLAKAAAQAFASATPVQETDPELHPMFPPFDAARRKGEIAARARKAIREGVIPAFRAFGKFLRDEYVPRCRVSIASPENWYRVQLARHTTLDLTADEIHATGRKEVARIRAEMMTVIARTDFEKKDDFRAFVDYLRSDPRFYFEDKEELLAGYRDIAKRIDAWMPRLFGKLPRLPYGVKEMPLYIATASPTAYYYSGSLETGMPGYFMANTFRLDQRPRYEMIPLTLHEAVPGHHHQIALAQEMEGVPEWRTLLGYTAFVEGWALYAERLGLEMGSLLADPYDDFGRLSYEMWRAMRLVVDTGMHAKGWSRSQAVDYMLANSALTRQNVEREVDRYIAWPGQATAYKIGELRIRALRAQAEEQLGKKFDLRAFHDMLLEEGALPLPLLERRALAWIEAAR